MANPFSSLFKTAAPYLRDMLAGAAPAVAKEDELSEADRIALERSKRLRATAANRYREGYGGNVIGSQFSTGDPIEDMMLQRQGEREARLVGAEEALNEFAPRGAGGFRAPRPAALGPNDVADYGGQRLAYRNGQVVGFSGGTPLAPEQGATPGRFTQQGSSTFNSALTAALNTAGQNQMRDYAAQAMRERAQVPAPGSSTAPLISGKAAEAVGPSPMSLYPSSAMFGMARERKMTPSYVRSVMAGDRAEMPDRSDRRMEAMNNILEADAIGAEANSLRAQAEELQNSIRGTPIQMDGVPSIARPLLSVTDATKAKKQLAELLKKINDLEAKRKRADQGNNS